ncbi:MAG: alpha/beta fold hydrolase [Sphingomonadales bacterium]|nr:MAG: alpha/beta fold hydrolase [Sphingomonadales bacterium]
MKVLLVLAAAMALAAPGIGLTQTARATLNDACRVASKPVSEQGFVRIGGIDQWVVIRGQDCANPVLLIVHGGPGNPNTPFADRLFGEWAKDFTIVHWDQRGAGKTYGASKPAEDEALTIERLTQDGIEIARYATERLGKRKVILMGGSWGSALAVHMALAEPKLFHAYVGTAQLVNYHADVAAGYARTLGLARAAGDADSVAKLEKLMPPPWTDPRSFGVLRRATRKYEAMTSNPAPKDWFIPAPGYDTPAYEADYEAGEEYSFLQFVGLKGDGMGPAIDLPKLGTRFAMPVYLLQGEADLVTPPEISRAYFDKLSAPEKEFILMPRTGHDPNIVMLDTQYRVLKDKVRKQALAAERQ